MQKKISIAKRPFIHWISILIPAFFVGISTGSCSLDSHSVSGRKDKVVVDQRLSDSLEVAKLLEHLSKEKLLQPPRDTLPTDSITRDSLQKVREVETRKRKRKPLFE